MTALDPPYPTGQITYRIEDRGWVLHLTGEVDAAVVEEFERSISWTAPPVVAVDASAVTFMASSAVALLVRRTEGQRKAGRPPALRRPSRAARSVLWITGVDALFPTT